MVEIQGASYDAQKNKLTIGDDFDWSNLNLDSDTEIMDQMGITDRDGLTIKFDDDNGINSTNEFTVNEASRIEIDNDGNNDVKSNVNLRVTSGSFGSVTIIDTMDASGAGMDQNITIDNGATYHRSQTHKLSQGQETKVNRTINGEFEYGQNQTNIYGDNLNSTNLDAQGEQIESSSYKLTDSDGGGSGKADLNFNILQKATVNASTENAAGLNAANELNIEIQTSDRSININGNISQDMNFDIGEKDTDYKISCEQLQSDFLSLFDNGEGPLGYIDSSNSFIAFSEDQIGMLQNGTIPDGLFESMVTTNESGDPEIQIANEEPEVPGDYIGIQDGELRIGANYFNSDGSIKMEELRSAIYDISGATGNAMEQDLLVDLSSSNGVKVGEDGSIQISDNTTVWTAAPPASTDFKDMFASISDRRKGCDPPTYAISQADLAEWGYEVNDGYTCRNVNKGDYFSGGHGWGTSASGGDINVSSSGTSGHEAGVQNAWHLEYVLTNYCHKIGASSGEHSSGFAERTFDSLADSHVETAQGGLRTLEDGTSWDAVEASSNSDAGQWTLEGGSIYSGQSIESSESSEDVSERGANALMLTGPNGEDLNVALLSWNGREFLTDNNQANFDAGGNGARLKEETLSFDLDVTVMSVSISTSSPESSASYESESMSESYDESLSEESLGQPAGGKERTIESKSNDTTKTISFNKLTGLEHDPVNHLSINITGASEINSDNLTLEQDTSGTVGTELAGGTFIAGNKMLSNINVGSSSQSTDITVDGDSVKELKVQAANVSTLTNTDQSISTNETGNAVTSYETANVKTGDGEQYSDVKDTAWIDKALNDTTQAETIVNPQASVVVEESPESGDVASYRESSNRETNIDEIVANNASERIASQAAQGSDSDYALGGYGSVR